ncbi:hypothetical protein DOTSEDRAFT_35630 [Dothistroma septosporum NZE10]|uniref:Uncharacterized protein n=1 Tax=Dothistroma septosporum (strain NZE10 / CBS 128990) TaxID=675120 RepID=M2WMW5_DOTSN|nr:hypothetical protein DOTSEDRAFT_35630 [Dothistroma septosporum NZE10]
MSDNSGESGATLKKVLKNRSKISWLVSVKNASEICKDPLHSMPVSNRYRIASTYHEVTVDCEVPSKNVFRQLKDDFRTLTAHDNLPLSTTQLSATPNYMGARHQSHKWALIVEEMTTAWLAEPQTSVRAGTPEVPHGMSPASRIDVPALLPAVTYYVTGQLTLC